MAKKKSTGTVVAIREPVSDRQAFYAMLERAASNKNVDVAKMQALMAMKAEEQNSESWQAFAQSMVEAQTGMLPIRKDMKADRFKYASLEALDDKIRPIYTKVGFSPSFSAEPMPDGRVLVVCDLYHRSGVSRRFTIPMTPSAKGAKGGDVMTQIQAEGGASSFGRRYLLLMMFNIITTEDDRDVRPEPIVHVTADQVADLVRACSGAKIDTNKFCLAFGIRTIAELPASKYQEAVDRITEFKRKFERKQPANAAV